MCMESNNQINNLGNRGASDVLGDGLKSGRRGRGKNKAQYGDDQDETDGPLHSGFQTIMRLQGYDFRQVYGIQGFGKIKGPLQVNPVLRRRSVEFP